MLAAQYSSFGGPISVEHTELPQLHPEGGVIVKVEATGVCKSDWHGWMGHDGDIANWFLQNEGKKFVPGHEVSGTIYDAGDSTKFEVGDRVAIPFILSCGACQFCQKGRVTICERQEQPGFTFIGSYAEYVSVPRADRNLTKLPDNISFVEAAALGCRTTTSFRAVVQQGKLRAGQKVAVFGCGGLGLAAIMIAKACGAGEIVAFDVRKEALEMAEKIEPSVKTVLMEREDRDDAPKDFDLSIECSGFAAACESAVKVLKPGGRMVQAGLCLGSQVPLVPMGLVTGREIEIVGSHGFDGANDMQTILNLVSAGLLQPSKLVEKEVSLQEGVQILQNMSTTSPVGVVMITKFR